MCVILCLPFNSIKIADETNSLQNANTISYTTSAIEQIDNAELQDKIVETSTESSGLDDNENDKDSKNEDGIKSTAGEPTTPVVTDLNNGPFNDDESYVSVGY